MGGGGGNKQLQEDQRLQAERSFQLQKDIFEDQKKQVALLEAGKSSTSAAEVRRKERILASKRVGRRATILTGPMGLPSSRSRPGGILFGGTGG